MIERSQRLLLGKTLTQAEMGKQGLLIDKTCQILIKILRQFKIKMEEGLVKNCHFMGTMY